MPPISLHWTFGPPLEKFRGVGRLLDTKVPEGYGKGSASTGGCQSRNLWNEPVCFFQSSHSDAHSLEIPRLTLCEHRISSRKWSGYGKPPKLAFIALARHLLLHLNSLISFGQKKNARAMGTGAGWFCLNEFLEPFLAAGNGDGVGAVGVGLGGRCAGPLAILVADVVGH